MPINVHVNCIFIFTRKLYRVHRWNGSTILYNHILTHKKVNLSAGDWPTAPSFTRNDDATKSFFFFFFFFYTEHWYLEIGGTNVSLKFHVKIKCCLTKKVKPSSLWASFQMNNIPLWQSCILKSKQKWLLLSNTLLIFMFMWDFLISLQGSTVTFIFWFCLLMQAFQGERNVQATFV